MLKQGCNLPCFCIIRDEDIEVFIKSLSALVSNTVFIFSVSLIIQSSHNINRNSAMGWGSWNLSGHANMDWGGGKQWNIRKCFHGKERDKAATQTFEMYWIIYWYSKWWVFETIENPNFLEHLLSKLGD